MPNDLPCFPIKRLPKDFPIQDLTPLKRSKYDFDPSEPCSHVPEYLDSLLPLPMLQYPQDPPPSKTTSSLSDKCLPDQSAPPSPATTSPPTRTDQSSTDLSSPLKLAPTATTKTSQPKKRTIKRSWMTVKRQSSSLRPASSGILTPSPSRLPDMSKTAVSRRLLSLSGEDSQTRLSGSRSSTTVEWRGIPPRTALTTSRTYARSMPSPSTQLIPQSHCHTGSTRPFKGPPPPTPPSSTPSKPPTTGGWKPMSCDSGPSTSASSPTRPSSTALTANSRAPSSPENSARAVWSARVSESGFRIWRENRCACPPTPRLAGDGKRDEDVASKGGCNVIDLTNEESSSDDEEL